MRRRRNATAWDWIWFVFDVVFGLWLSFTGPRWIIAVVMVSLAGQVLAAKRLLYWTKRRAELDA